MGSVSFRSCKMLLLIPLSLLSIGSQSASAAAPYCVWPGGGVASKTDLGICLDSHGNKTGFCCGPGHFCLANNLCVGSDNQFYRGGCTDDIWFSPNCTSVCGDLQHAQSSAPVSHCPKDKQGDRPWVCGNDLSACQSDGQVFELSDDMSVAGTVTQPSPESGEVSSQQLQTSSRAPSASASQVSATKTSSVGASFSKASATSTALGVQSSSTPALTSAMPAPTLLPPTPPPGNTVTSLPSPEIFLPPGVETAPPPSPSNTSEVLPKPTGPSPPSGPSSSSKNLITIGLGIGAGAIMLAGSVLAFVFARKRHRQRHAVRAETPPLMDLPDFSNSHKPGSSGGSSGDGCAASVGAGRFYGPTDDWSGGRGGRGGNDYEMKFNANRNEFTRPVRGNKFAGPRDGSQGSGVGVENSGDVKHSTSGRRIPVDSYTAGLPGVHRVREEQEKQQEDPQKQVRWGSVRKEDDDTVYEMA